MESPNWKLIPYAQSGISVMDQTQPTVLNGTFNCSKRLDDQDEATLRSPLALDISSMIKKQNTVTVSARSGSELKLKTE
jgi:hypothetical protein